MLLGDLQLLGARADDLVSARGASRILAARGSARAVLDRLRRVASGDVHEQDALAREVDNLDDRLAYARDALEPSDDRGESR